MHLPWISVLFCLLLALAAPTTAAAQQDDAVAASASSPSSPDASCDLPRADPLPRPGSPTAADFWNLFRAPLPPAPVYDPAGQRRVGLQAGHWQLDQLPAELHGLDAGSSGGGKQEWEVNLDLAQRTAALLEAQGVAVDVLPATPPVDYRAHLFLAIHADGDTSGDLHGFKIARPGFSAIPDVDDTLVNTLYTDYAAITGLPRDDDHVSRRMSYYYAFNSRRYCHAVAPGVPQAIIEAGYLTSAVDRQYLIGDPDLLARGIAQGIADFLAGEP
ncbi:MAG: N-acetylmuramoyl-L-alanine amidase [Chloroflexi bacterium]|nr:N-acetylmuramoyl-L-alanine amidase [Chloroflexota bacterium]